VDEAGQADNREVVVEFVPWVYTSLM
jgi:hypothetical protein